MKKPYIEQQKLYPLDIYNDGKQLLSYRPDKARGVLDLKNAVQKEVNKVIESSAVSSEESEKEILNVTTPIIAENYADGIRQLTPDSYLYNPSFANDAKGWNFSESDRNEGKVKFVISDNKIRLLLQSGGTISQSNERIKKPPYHLIYEERAIEYGSQAKAVSEETQWEDIEEVTINDKTRTETDSLYLKVTFKCNSNGTLRIGFPDASHEESWMLQYIEREVTAPGVQTIETSGVWDETGDFMITFDGGSIEIMELSLTGKPLEEYRNQVNSAVTQIYDNLFMLLGGWASLRNRIYLIQNEIGDLQNNDKQTESALQTINQELETIKATLESQEQRITEAATLAAEANQTATYFSYEVASLSAQVTDLAARVGALEQA